MASRAIANGNISFGLVSIPVHLFTATVSKSVAFHLLHAKDKSRIQQRIYCPVDDAIIERSELERGYEVEKGRYVVFTDEELKNLEARNEHTIEITEFVPLSAVDPIYFENGYFLGSDTGAAKAYRLLTEAMVASKRVALGRFTMRGKEHLIVIRPYEKGLMLHTVYYADEVRSSAEIDRGQHESVKEAELTLAKRLIDDLTVKKFEPEKYHDSYRERVQEAARQKLTGQEVAEAPAEPRHGQVIDLMAALKASLEKRAKAEPAASEEADDQKPGKGSRGSSRTARAAGERRSGSKR
ncbi:MAG: Ku protein [Candidatus Binataceae bacterium]|nr:Ku protein [Candidatus Binataceae bacterium]